MTGKSAKGTGKITSPGHEDTDKMPGDQGAAAMAGMPGDASVGSEGVDMPGDAAMSAGSEQPHGAMPAARVDDDGAGASTDSGMPGGDMNAPPAGGGMGGDGGGDGGDDGARGDDGEPLPQRRECGTMEGHRILLSSSPGYAAARDAIENQTLAFERSGGAQERAGITRLPTVVHVVWNTATQNVSDAQVQSQIAVLNRDFRRTNPDVAGTPAPFLPLATDARIEFFLATTDPNGNPTTGIVRRQTTVTAFGQNDAVKSNATGGSDAWPSQRYLNIWVCRLAGGLLGYAQFPGGPAATDGVVIRDTAFGTVGTAAVPFNLGRTATHEVGHWLNLNHIWGDDGTGCSGTDNVVDTPNQAGENTGVPAFPKLSCSNGPNGDMFMNYMDYTDDRGMFMFSAGQVTRMQACLDGPRSQIGLGGGGSTAAPRPSSNPVVAWGPNRIDVFVLGTDRALYHKAWDGSAWWPSTTGYEGLGGVCTCVPQAVAWGPNRLDVFVTGTDRALYHKWWDGSRWGPSVTGYEFMGGVIVGTPRAVSWGANRLDVFVVGTDQALYHKWWDGSRWGPSITSYEFMGGTIIGQPEIVSWGNGRLDVFVIGSDRALYHKWFDGSRWGPSLTGWESLGGVCTSAPRAVCWGPNRIDVFVTGTDSALYHKWWDGSRWGPSIGGWERQGGVCIGQPEAVAWGPNRLDVFVLGTNRAVYHKWWNGSAWGPSLTGFEAQGGVCTAGPRAVAWGPNRLDLFVRGTDNALYHKAWNGAAWWPSLTGYAGLGGVITSM